MLGSEIDRKDTGRNGRISGVWGTAETLEVVIVDLPIDRFSVVLDDSKVVFSIGIVVLRKVFERSHLGKDFLLVFCWQTVDSLCENNGTTQKGLAEHIV